MSRRIVHGKAADVPKAPPKAELVEGVGRTCRDCESLATYWCWCARCWDIERERRRRAAAKKRRRGRFVP